MLNTDEGAPNKPEGEDHNPRAETRRHSNHEDKRKPFFLMKRPGKHANAFFSGKILPEDVLQRK